MVANENSASLNSDKEIFSAKKEEDISNWYSEIIKTAELVDLRYNVKGFVVYQPWAVRTLELMYGFFEKNLQEREHEPYFFPALIPEKNFNLESSHIEGFAPEVFWVTEHGAGEKFDEKLALRPTSETAFYQMFSLWIRSYQDLPFRTYQRAQVWRYETSATRPLLRSREFFWLESHCAFPDKESAFQNVLGDMKTTESVMHQIFGVPFIYFQRPQWDKFPGADNTFGADALTPSGRVVQQPSTHMLGTNFSKPFNVSFVDKEGNSQFAYLTCYGPAISRILASVILTHGDDKGLRFPFEIAPKQIVIVPIAFEKNSLVLEKAKELKSILSSTGFRVELDSSSKRPGEKFYFWEMKGVPIRIELGPKELDSNKLVLFRRDTSEKVSINESELIDKINFLGKAISKNLKDSADEWFSNSIIDVSSYDEIADVVGKGIARCNFCSLELDGESCAEKIEKELFATVRGKRIDKQEKPNGVCVVCGKPAKEVVYIAKQY